jgi:hypothetical protein
VQKRQLEIVGWLIKFMQVDLDTIPEDERYLHLSRIATIASAIHDHVKGLQKYEEMVEREKAGGALSMDLTKKIQAGLKNFLGDLSALTNPNRKRRFLKSLPPMEAALGLDESNVFEMYWFPHPDKSMDYETRVEKFWIESAVINLGFLLKDVSRDSIRRCEGCGKFFFNPTKKRKDHCTPNCTWKANSRKRWEKIKTHPHLYNAYKKKQRELMKKKYDKDGKIEYGPKWKKQKYHKHPQTS